MRKKRSVRPLHALQLDLRMEPQQQTNWCWAAVGVSIKKFYRPDSSLLQCELASMEFREDCCSNPKAHDKPWFITNTLKRVGHYKDGEGGSYIVSMDEVQREIVNGRPIVCKVEWETGGEHYICIRGYIGDRYLRIEDPLHGTVLWPYDELKTHYLGNGTWTETYRTKP
jgi:Papain-like cysteine protease AvrRpt2